MQAVIFCGGKGTRISGGDQAVKKELVEIGGRPILWHVMKILATYGCKDFILPLGYRGDLIRRYFLDYERMNRDVSFYLSDTERVCFWGENHEGDWRVTLIDTGLESSKGERLRRVTPYITSERFFLLYGDDVADINIAELVRFHLSHGKAITITGYQPAYQYGVVEVNPEGLITEYRQYPQLDHWINAGFMVIERNALDALQEGMDLETEFLTHMVRRQQVMLYRHRGFWRSMNTFKDAQELNELWDAGRAPWKIW